MPHVVFESLQAGTGRFVAGSPLRHDVHDVLRMVATGASPPAAILSCIDSCVPVETVLDLPVGRAALAGIAA